MPRYDYRCSVCGHEVELLRGIHDSGPRVCPNCGAVGSMRKAFATPAVHYKGSGWAKKDRSSSTRPAASSNSTDGSKDGSGSGHGETGDSSDSGGNGRPQDGGTEGGAEVGADRGGDNATVTSSVDGNRTTGAGKAETGRRAATKPAPDRGAV